MGGIGSHKTRVQLPRPPRTYGNFGRVPAIAGEDQSQRMAGLKCRVEAGLKMPLAPCPQFLAGFDEILIPACGTVPAYPSLLRVPEPRIH
jgi:hypothetical protein